MKKPHYTDHCQHLQDGNAKGVFVGTTVHPIHGEILDVYIWGPAERREVCIRYGESGEQYASCFGTPEVWSDSKRTVSYNDKLVLASRFDGPAMELVRAYLAREKA